MFFAFDITVTAGTTDAAPKTQDLPITLGIVESVEIKFPAGCNGLVKIRILHTGNVIVPLSANQYVTGDDEPVITKPQHQIESGTATLVFQGSSPNATYDHTITVRINVLEPAAAPATASDMKALGGNLGEKLDYIIFLLSREWDLPIPALPLGGYVTPAPAPAPTPTPTPPSGNYSRTGRLIPTGYTWLHWDGMPEVSWDVILDIRGNTEPIQLIWLRFNLTHFPAGATAADWWAVANFALGYLDKLSKTELFRVENYILNCVQVQYVSRTQAKPLMAQVDPYLHALGGTSITRWEDW